MCGWDSADHFVVSLLLDQFKRNPRCRSPYSPTQNLDNKPNANRSPSFDLALMFGQLEERWCPKLVFVFASSAKQVLGFLFFWQSFSEVWWPKSQYHNAVACGLAVNSVGQTGMISRRPTRYGVVVLTFLRPAVSL